MTIKVLPLDGWMRDKRRRDETIRLSSAGYMPIKPRFRRPGMYLIDNKICWFELDDGRAFTMPKGDFLYDLRQYAALTLTIKQADALRAVCRENLATKEQKQLLSDYDFAMDSRRRSRDIRRRLLSYKRRIKLQTTP